jgi:TRAP-type mannitol/chloroaromatic compound transport system permease small subunit
MSTHLLCRMTAAIDNLSEWTGRSIAWLTLAMVLVQFTIVVLRYAFNTGWIAMQESILFMHALVFLLGAAFTLKRDAHVRVDIFYSRMSGQGKAVVDLLGTLLLLLPVCLFIFVMSWEYVTESWRLLEGSREAGGLPGVFLLKSTMLLMAGLLMLQGVAMLGRSLVTLLASRSEKDDA